MFKRIYIFFLVLFLSGSSGIFGQRVGLVLSGGGAKGLAHVGLIDALEQNEIPIDYISGTSIGAVVGGLYSIGYSPKEMLDLFMSKDFYYWQTGKVEDNNNYYYFRKSDDTPEFVRFTVPLKDSTDVLGSILPTNLINPIQMNQAFMGLFSQATAVSGEDFNNLMVPFLSVAADVYNKKTVISRSGDLGDAVRASMTFPFVFRPIIKDSIPLFDGGLYDNFPIKPMVHAFKPDFIIGSAVAGVSKKAEKMDRSLYGQLESMIIGQKTDYSVNPEKGIFFRFAFEDVGLLDFDRAQELYDIGYQRGMEMVDSIRLRVNRTVSPEEVAKKRAEFRSRMPELVFQNVVINGAKDEQSKYIESQLRSEDQKTFGMDDFREAYFKLLANTKIKEIIPHAQYNQTTGYFDLILDVKIDDEVKVAFGGNISSSNANQFYLGLGYQSLTNYALDLNLDLQVGNAFSGVLLQGRFDPPYKFPIYVKLMGAFNYRKYYESEKLFIDDNLLTFMQQREGYFKLAIGMPFEKQGKSEIRVGYGSLEDKYFQSNTSFSNADFDVSSYNLFSLGISIEKNTFDAKQYPITGKNHYILSQFIAGTESYKPGSRYSPVKDKTVEGQSWLQVFGRINNYHTVSKRFNYGYLLEGVISSKNLQSNYTASIMQAPAFTPTPHSKLVFNEAFRANQYIALGIIPIYKINQSLHLRCDFNVFAPIRAIKQDANYKAYYGKLFSDIAYMGTASLVLQLPFLSVSLYGSTYSFPNKDWHFGLNIGYVIFNPKFTE